MTVAYVDQGMVESERRLNRAGGTTIFARVIRPGLQKEKIVLASIQIGHLHERLMVNSLFVATEAAPVGFVLKNGVKQCIDSEGFSGTCIARDQPPTAEIVPVPGKAGEACRDLFRLPCWCAGPGKRQGS